MADTIDDTTNSASTSSSMATTTNTSTSPTLRFTGVQLYLFRRKQGFNCVPSRGGTTLGMAERHFDEHQVSLDGEEVVSENLYSEEENDDDDDDNDDDSARVGHVTRKRCSSAIESIPQDKASLAELRPLPVRQRRRLLRLSGVKKIDTNERFECEAIRLSRNECGCQNCGAVCLPETCPCSISGIACQVDKMAYPCSCTREGCHNVEGRIEFNAVRVRRHLIHTLSKLYANSANEQNGGGSSEDSGAAEDDIFEEDNCDAYGRCRHCHLHDPPVVPSKRQQLIGRPESPPDVDEISQDEVDDVEFHKEKDGTEESSDAMPIHEFSSSIKQASPAVVATKMLRRKWHRHWRQKAQSSKSGSKLVSKLVLMRRAMASTGGMAASDDSVGADVRQ